MEKTVKLTNQEVSRVLAALRERHRKLKKGIEKFGDNYDPNKSNMLDGMNAYQSLIHKIQEQVV